jgi:oligopeptidase B
MNEPDLLPEEPEESRRWRRTLAAIHRLHGHAREDPYAWLKDPNWRAVMRDPERLDPEIRAYLEAENAYTAAEMAPYEALRRRLVEELKGRIKPDDASVPLRDGPYLYYRRFRPDGQYPVFARRHHALEAPEQILLDGDLEAEGLPCFSVAACRHSPDHRLLAYAVDGNGAEIYTILLRDLASGETLPDRLTGARGDVVWAADGRTLFYTVLDEEHRPRRVYRHRVGDDQTEDRLVYEEPDPGFFIDLDRTESRRFVLIRSYDHTTSEVRYLDAALPDGAFALIEPRTRDIKYDATDYGGRWLILTNADGALDYKIVEAPLERPGRAQWRDVVPHEPGRLIHRLLAFRDFTVRLERLDALPRIVVRRTADGAEHAVAFEEEAYELGLVRGYEHATSTLRFTYASPATPERVYDYDMVTRERILRKEQEIPSGHDPSAYIVRRLFAASHDGERVPISLLQRRDAPRDGSAPLLLYGYGSYGITVPAGFEPNRLSLVDRGFVYAIAHVRGGRERGQRWYEQGKLAHKRNTFLDFIAAAERLVADGYTSAGRIAVNGRSAGGLLVGAVLNMRPDLFRAAVAGVPFVDILNTMSDPDLPLTPPEWPEWGNPIADEEAYRTILAYAPYDNVSPQPYPHILVTAGLTDPRVTYWEPAKWVAKLRALKRDDNLLLLRTEMTAGHRGPSGRFSHLEEVALTYAFLLRVFGLSGPADAGLPASGSSGLARGGGRGWTRPRRRSGPP